MSMRARFGGRIKWIFAAVPAVPEVAVGQDSGDAVQVFQELFIADVHASSPCGNRVAMLLWETEGAGLADAAVSRRSAGAHSDVRFAVVPLSGEVRSGCKPPSLDIYAKRSKNVRFAKQSERRR